MIDIDVPALVINSLNEIISEMDEKDQQQIKNLDKSTRIIGRKAVLDSLGLVSVIVDIEQKLSDVYAIDVTIADERAMSQEKSPFRTVGSLVEYVSLLLQEQTQ